MTDVLLGRQPILDRDERVHGYELLCRSEGDSRASALDGDRRTATVVLNAFVELGVDAPPDPGPTFVRMTARFLLEELYLSLPKEQVVLTLGVEDDPPPAVVDALRAARMRGFRTALDRVDGRPALARPLRFVEFARVDVAALGLDAAAALGPTLRDAGVTPVATKVETRDAFDACRDAGYDLFQGFFFRRPDEVRARRVPTARRPVVELLTRVRDPEVDHRRHVR
ncbi:MAG: EAL and HDOD domain-containing protein, partial [Planctomycetota bacterium JB042]